MADWVLGSAPAPGLLSAPAATVVKIRKATLLRGEFKQGDTRTAQKVFIVSMSGKPASDYEIINHPDIPANKEPFTDGDDRLATDITIKTLGDSIYDYVVTVDYAVPDGGTLEIEPNPLMRLDDLAVKATSNDQPYFMDFSDEPLPVTTSAGEPFENLPKNTVGRHTLTITGNRSTYPADDWAAYMDKKSVAINSDAFTIRGIAIAAGHAKMVGIRAKPVTENGIHFWACEWDIDVADTWDQEILDRGTVAYFSDPSSGTEEEYLLPIVLKDGATKVTKPYPLDGTGHIKENSTDTPEKITFKPQKKLPFAVFTFDAAAY